MQLAVLRDDFPISDGNEDVPHAAVARWRAVGREYAAASVRFVTDPTWRSYVISYSAGRDLCGTYLEGDPARCRRLLTEQVRVQDLLSAEVSSAS